jgi:predicted HTH domain antitoxin
MPKFSLDIPDDVADALRLPPDEAEQEVRKELAVTLYARQLLPLSKARQLAGLSRREFESLLGDRQIPRHYSEEDLEEDLDDASGDAPESEAADEGRE